MPVYLSHAERILQAAGIDLSSTVGAELLHLLSERARDWADRAIALGSEMDAEAATNVAARTLAADPGMRKRLEELEVDAIAVFLKLCGPSEEPAAPVPGKQAPQPKRRWGEGAQPTGSPAPDAFGDLLRSQAAPRTLGLAVGELLDLPVYGSDRNLVGVVKSVMVSTEGDVPTGIVLTETTTRPSR